MAVLLHVPMSPNAQEWGQPGPPPLAPQGFGARHPFAVWLIAHSLIRGLLMGRCSIPALGEAQQNRAQELFGMGKGAQRRPPFCAAQTTLPLYRIHPLPASLPHPLQPLLPLFHPSFLFFPFALFVGYNELHHQRKKKKQGGGGERGKKGRKKKKH